MKLKRLFKLQRELDERIVKEKGLSGQDLLPNKVLALQVELGELANEWRGFKFWSHDQEPRTKIEYICPTCNGTGDENYDSYIDDLEGGYTHEVINCEDCGGTGTLGYKNPLLEEYVDCLHFLLSIGNDINMNEVYEDSVPEPLRCDDIIEQFMYVNDWINYFYHNRHEDVNGEVYDLIFSNFLGLGEMLGFTWEEIEEAYLRKNAVNHQRQECGY
ncbi:dUTPase [Geobacillus thermoleovorans]|uniref:dUTPase n=1 Tax=Geobacillus thermoleovorans TaxID=33941 RepID=A0A2Z3N4I8_GEOTH|nr:dUTP diphosphatase [Geobacillus thermoleovorans]AWO73902.1 dUTPase [Geobacillus thermoleovorans]